MACKITSTLLLYIFCLTTYSCQKNTGSILSSLTQEELEFCNFTGKRYLLIITPDSPSDVDLMQNIFQDFTHTFRISNSHLEARFKGNLKKLNECRQSLKSTGRYELHAALEPNKATWDNFQKQLDLLHRKIIADRSDFQDRGEIQVLIAFSSHELSSKDNSSGTFVFANKPETHIPPNIKIPAGANQLNQTTRQVPFLAVAQLLYEKLFSRSMRMSPDEAREVRLADEIMIFMDNSFSGNFNEHMTHFLQQTAYPTVTEIPATATRIIAFNAYHSRKTSSSQEDEKFRESVLISALKETMQSFAGDYNKDGILSIEEFAQFLREHTSTLEMDSAILSLQSSTSNLICGPSSNRLYTVNHIRQNSPYYQKFWSNPLAALRQKSELPQAANSFYWSNIDRNLSTRMAFAIPAGSEPRTTSGLHNHQEWIHSEKYNEQQIVKLSAFQRKAFEIIMAQPNKYISHASAEVSLNSSIHQKPADSGSLSGENTSGPIPLSNHTSDPQISIEELGIGNEDLLFYQHMIKMCRIFDTSMGPPHGSIPPMSTGISSER